MRGFLDQEEGLHAHGTDPDIQDAAGTDGQVRNRVQAAPGCICFVLNLAVIGYFQSLERLTAATLFALLRGALLLVPCFVLLPRLLGVPGIWLAMPLSESLTFLCIVGWITVRRRGRLSL